MSSRKFLVPANLLNLAEDPATGTSGDIYFNTTSDKLKIYDGAAWVEVGTSGGSQTTVSDTAPATPNIGDSWYNNETGSLYVYDGTYWVEVNGIIEGTNTFSHISVSGQSDLVADSITDVLTFVAGTNIGITTNATTDSITINSTGNYTSVDSITYPDYITFDTTPEVVPTATGSLFWDEGDGLPKAILNANVELGIGQEQVALVKNATGSTIAKGKVVYINGAQGQRPTIALSDADTEATSSKTLGITAESLIDGAEGFVTTFGVLRGVNTNGLTEGAALWLSSTAGGYTTTIPDEPAHLVFVGYVVKASSTAGEIFVNPQNGYELNELHGVLINGVDQDNVLRYDESSGLWKNTHPNVVTAKNATESTIAAFTPVYINTQEFDQTNITFAPADAATSMYLAKLPADAITVESVSSNSSTKLVTMGIVTGVNVTGYNLGDLLYVGVGGGLTSTRPTGTNAIQPFARVLSTDNGTIYVYGNTFASSIQTLPNLATNKVWLGTSGRPVETTLDTSVVAEGTNLYFTEERAQDAASLMITSGSHNGVSVEYVDASGIFNFTNTGVTSLYGTTNEISLTGGPTGSITIGIPDSPVFVTPNIGAATASSIVVGGATTKTTSTEITSSSATTIATFPVTSGNCIAVECVVLMSSTSNGSYTASKVLITADPDFNAVADITEYAIINNNDYDIFPVLTASLSGSNVLLRAAVANSNGVTAKVVSTSILSPHGAA